MKPICGYEGCGLEEDHGVHYFLPNAGMKSWNHPFQPAAQAGEITAAKEVPTETHNRMPMPEVHEQTKCAPVISASGKTPLGAEANPASGDERGDGESLIPCCPTCGAPNGNCDPEPHHNGVIRMTRAESKQLLSFGSLGTLTDAQLAEILRDAAAIIERLEAELASAQEVIEQNFIEMDGLKQSAESAEAALAEARKDINFNAEKFLQAEKARDEARNTIKLMIGRQRDIPWTEFGDEHVDEWVAEFRRVTTCR